MIWIAKLTEEPLTDGAAPHTDGRSWAFSVGTAVAGGSGGVEITHGWRYTKTDGVARLYPPRAVGKNKVWNPTTTDEVFRDDVKRELEREIAQLDMPAIAVDENRVLVKLLADDALHGGKWAEAWRAAKDAEPKTVEQAAYRLCLRFLATVDQARRLREGEAA